MLNEDISNYFKFWELFTTVSFPRNYVFLSPQQALCFPDLMIFREHDVTSCCRGIPVKYDGSFIFIFIFIFSRL